MKVSKTPLIVACIGVTAILIYVVIHRTKEYRPAKGELTRVEIIEIASGYLEPKLKYFVNPDDRDILDYGGSIDKNNRYWNEFLAGDFLNLRGRNYQAVKFKKKARISNLRVTNLESRISGGWGTFWVCVDRKTGEVLAFTAE